MPGDQVAAAAELSVRALAPGIIAALSSRGQDISFDYLGVPRPQRGAGLADKAIAVVCAQADEHQVMVWMEPNSGFGSDLRRMIPWYSRHGFVPVTGIAPFTMRRHPTAHVTDDPSPSPFGDDT